MLVSQLLPYCAEAKNGGLNELAFRCDPASKPMSNLGTTRLACPVFTRIDSRKALFHASNQLLPLIHERGDVQLYRQDVLEKLTASSQPLRPLHEFPLLGSKYTLAC